MPAEAKFLREKEFAKRMAQACENHHLAPDGHGRQKWLRERIFELFSQKLSPEGVRKWFSGEARPRPTLMHKVAQALEVDEAWLALGITPTATPQEKRKQNALAAGAINLVAAHIQLAGGNIAFPESEREGFDLSAIILGKQYSLNVCFVGHDKQTQIAIARSPKTVVVVIPTTEPTVFEFARIPQGIIERFGYQRGGYTNLDVERTPQGLSVGGVGLPVIKRFDEIDGVLPKRPVGRPKKELQGLFE